jgi:hypothetical protein
MMAGSNSTNGGPHSLRIKRSLTPLQTPAQKGRITPVRQHNTFVSKESLVRRWMMLKTSNVQIPKSTTREEEPIGNSILDAYNNHTRQHLKNLVSPCEPQFTGRGTRVTTIKTKRECYDVCFLGDNHEFVAAAHKEFGISVYEIEEVSQLSIFAKDIEVTEMCPIGNTYLAVVSPHLIQVFNWRTGKMITEVQPKHAVDRLYPFGMRYLVALVNSKAEIWDISQGESKRISLPVDRRKPKLILDIVFMKNSKLCLLHRCSVSIYDLKTRLITNSAHNPNRVSNSRESYLLQLDEYTVMVVDPANNRYNILDLHAFRFHMYTYESVMHEANVRMLQSWYAFDLNNKCFRNMKNGKTWYGFVSTQNPKLVYSIISGVGATVDVGAKDINILYLFKQLSESDVNTLGIDMLDCKHFKDMRIVVHGKRRTTRRRGLYS